nr:PREDICTED: cell wall protein DAN4-like [Lepisosteus oculatus]
MAMNFMPQLNDRSSKEFHQLAATVTIQLDFVYRTKYGSIFIGVILLGFRPGSVIADTQLEFRSSNTTLTGTAIIKTLVEASENSSLTNFTLPLNTSAIQATKIETTTAVPTTLLTTPLPSTTTQPTNTTPTNSPIITPTTTPHATNTSTTPTITPANTPKTDISSATPTTTPSNSTITSTTSSTARTTATKITETTTAPTTPSIPTYLTRFALVFSLIRSFEPGLNDPSSTQYKELELNVTKQLNTIYKKKYGILFIQSKVTGFRQGSVITTTELDFRSSAPSAIEIANAFKDELANFTPPVDNTTIQATKLEASTAAPASTTVTTGPARPASGGHTATARARWTFLLTLAALVLPRAARLDSPA